MTKATLTKFPGVYRRTDSGVYQFGLRAPADLLGHFPNGWAVRCSLRTSDLRTANGKAKALQADWAAKFEVLRTGKPVPIDLRAVRIRLYTQFEAILNTVDRQCGGIVGAARHERMEMLLWQLGEARHAIKEGFVPDWAEANAEKLGFPRGPLVDAEYMAHLVMVLEIQHEALIDETRTFPRRIALLQARRALIDSMPVVSQVASFKNIGTVSLAEGRCKMNDALQEWALSPRSEKTQATFARHAKQFADMMGDPFLETIDKALAIKFRDKLQAWAIENHKTANTADNVLVSIRALVNVARDKGWILGNPFERLTVKVGGKESEGARALDAL